MRGVCVLLLSPVALLGAAILLAEPEVPSSDKPPLPRPEQIPSAMFDRPVPPEGNVVGLFRGDDYPIEALRKNEQGSTAVALVLDVKGRVTQCIVTVSSGSAALDSQTCRVLVERAKFEPARDAEGKAVASAVTQRISWKMSATRTIIAAPSAGAPVLLNRHELVTADDYPAVSVARDQEGAVTVRVNVDATGVVTDCAIAQSSGHPSLDAQTCALYRARALFEPARDDQGKPVAGDYVQKITWKLEGEPAPASPRQPWMIRSTVGLTSDGAVVDCKLESSGVSAQPQDCDLMVAMMSEMTGEQAKRDRTRPATAFTIAETYFYPVASDQAPKSPELGDATMLARQVSEITIQPDGRVSDCKGLDYSGSATPDLDACMFLRHQRFEPAAPGAPVLVGTVSMTAYLRKQSIT